MTRRRGTSRVGGGKQPQTARATEQAFPSLRERKPVMFWSVVLATGAMVIGVVASFVRAIL